jgi:hypothetical protein
MSSGRRARLQRLRERALKARQHDAIEIRLAPWLQEMADQAAPSAAAPEDAPRRQCPNETCGTPVTHRAEQCESCGAALAWAETEGNQ